MSATVCAVICAAGKGARAGFEKNKLLRSVNGIPVLQRTLQAFDYDKIHEIIVAYSPCDRADIERLVSGMGRVTLVEGGETRTQTVYNALQAVNSEIVLIHDGARPFVSREIIEGCIDSVKAYGSGICAVPCTDTIAVKNSADEIIRVPDRTLLTRIQTPQGFYTKVIQNAYRQAIETGNGNAVKYTDDSSVYGAFIHAPKLCKGAEENVKLTYANDFVEQAARCGFGIDTHAFGKPQNYIVLAGVKIPSESGLKAHSDGDVLVHAVMDAMLSAAGLKDIGHYFPDTDEKWKDANSMEMLKAVRSLVQEQGYRVKNLSVAIQAERPRLAKYIDDMKISLAEILELNLKQIGISAGTNEGLGYVGEGKGITVNAYVLLANIEKG